MFQFRDKQLGSNIPDLGFGKTTGYRRPPGEIGPGLPEGAPHASRELRPHPHEVFRGPGRCADPGHGSLGS